MTDTVRAAVFGAYFAQHYPHLRACGGSIEALRRDAETLANEAAKQWESMRTPPPTTSPPEKDGEAPEPLPEVLPVGTKVGMEDSVAFTPPRLREYRGEMVYFALWDGDNHESFWRPRDIDWSHWRSTHREALADQRSHAGEYRRDPNERHPVMGKGAGVGDAGGTESLPEWTDASGVHWYLRKFSAIKSSAIVGSVGTPTDEDLAACLRAMPEERRKNLLAPFTGELGAILLAEQRVRHEMADERDDWKERAESAEARERGAHRKLSDESASFMRTIQAAYDKREALDEELSAAKGKAAILGDLLPRPTPPTPPPSQGSGEAKAGEGDEEAVASWYRKNRPAAFCDWGELAKDEKAFHVELYQTGHSRGVAKGRAATRREVRQIAEYAERAHAAGASNVARTEALFHIGRLVRSLGALLSEEGG